MTSLKMDQFSLTFSKNKDVADKILYLYYVYEECLKCPFIKQQTLVTEHDRLIDSIHYPKRYRILNKSVDTSTTDSKEFVHCDIEHTFGEYGEYRVEIDNNGCTTTTVEEPTNMYLPILYVFLIYGGIFSAIYLFVYIYKKFTVPKVTSDVTNNSTKTINKRVQSLDTFRGISIVLMIFVNYGCGDYAVLDHAVWNGLQLADLVFPWFMWIMGVCMPISLSSIKKRGISKTAAMKNIFRRSCILFGLGLFLGASPYLDTLRIFGVLQRFGIAYFVVSTFCIMTTSNKPNTENDCNKLKVVTDIVNTLIPWTLAITLLIIHSLIIFFVADENCSKGYFGPGGYHENGKHFNCTGGATGYIDKLILGEHIYHKPTSKLIYKSQSFDPEGILGCFTSIIQVIIGFQAGVTLLTYKEHSSRLKRWLCWSLVTGLVGGGLCGFTKDDGVIPINKNLWSISFVLVTSSLAFLLLSLCYILIDVKRRWSGKPFLFVGMNAIIMYVGHNMTYNNFPIHWYTSNGPIPNETHMLTLIENVWATCAWVLIAYYLYRIKYFLSI